MFESKIFAGALQKNYLVQGDLMQTSQHGPMIWKVMQRNAWSGIATWPIKQLSNCTKSQLHALMTINNSWDMLENSENVQGVALFGALFLLKKKETGRFCCVNSAKTCFLV